MKDYNKIFKLFVGNDDLRPKMHHPFRYKDYWCATDAHAMVYIPVDIADVEHSEETINCSPFIPPQVTCHHVVNVADFKSKLIVELVPDETDCEECDGSGVVEYEYDGKDISDTQTLDCPLCNGHGTITNSKKLVPNVYANFRYKGVVFSYRNLIKLVSACEEMGEETFTVIHLDARKASYFKVAELTILIMPVMNDNYTEIQ